MKHTLHSMAGMGALVLAAVTAACGGGGTGGSGGTGGTGATGGTGTGGGTGGAGAGQTCGGLAGTTCPAGAFCDFADGSCGNADATGVCVLVPQVCPLEAAPWQVCGCDGMVYGDTCSAAMAGVDVAANGGCILSVGQFACGSLVCNLSTQYCQVTTSDVAGTPDGFTCLSLPATCTAGADCTCLAGAACASTCTKETDGHLTVTCPGG